MHFLLDVYCNVGASFLNSLLDTNRNIGIKTVRHKLMLTLLFFSCNRFSWFTWFTRTSFVDSNHSEFVSVTFVQVMYSECCIRRWVIVCSEPFATSFSLFHIVTWKKNFYFNFCVKFFIMKPILCIILYDNLKMK